VYRGKDESLEGEMSRGATNRLSQTTTWTSFRIPAETRELSPPPQAPTKALVPMGLVPLGVNRQERDAVHRPPPSTSVKNDCSRNYTPQYFFMTLIYLYLYPFPLKPENKGQKTDKTRKVGGRRRYQADRVWLHTKV